MGSFTPAPVPRQRPQDALRGAQSLSAQALAPHLPPAVGHCADVIASLCPGFHISKRESRSALRAVVRLDGEAELGGALPEGQVALGLPVLPEGISRGTAPQRVTKSLFFSVSRAAVPKVPPGPGHLQTLKISLWIILERSFCSFCPVPPFAQSSRLVGRRGNSGGRKVPQLRSRSPRQLCHLCGTQYTQL